VIKMRPKLSVGLTLFLCLLCLAACGSGGAGGQLGLGRITEPPPPVEPDDPETLALKDRFLAALLEKEYIQDAYVTMGNPIHAMARLREGAEDPPPLSFFGDLYLANPGWREGYEATETEKMYQGMRLTLIYEPPDATYQYQYHYKYDNYHDGIWDAASWSEGKIPFPLRDDTPGWDDTVKEYGDFIAGDGIFNEDDFYAIYRELGLESEGRLLNESGALERLGSPRRFFARYDDGTSPDTHLYLTYPFGQVYFGDTTLVRLTNDSVPGPRGTRVGDYYADVIAKFPQEENREDNYLYKITRSASPDYVSVASGEIIYDYYEVAGEYKIAKISYRNGRGSVYYDINDDFVGTIYTSFFTGD
jgi:hypothetical protein